MRSEPQFRIGGIWIDLVNDSAFKGEAGYARVEAADAPGVVFDCGAEGKDVAVRGFVVGVDGCHDGCV